MVARKTALGMWAVLIGCSGPSGEIVGGEGRMGPPGSEAPGESGGAPSAQEPIGESSAPGATPQGSEAAQERPSTAAEGQSVDIAPPASEFPIQAPGGSDPETEDDREPPDPAVGSGSGFAEPIIPSVTEDCPTFRNGTITFMGLSGIEVVAGSKAAGPTAPMVFYWHGTGGVAGEFRRRATAVSNGVVAEGGVLVSFQGTTGGDLLSGTSVFGRGDMDLVDQLAACAVRDHNVDPRRIFTTGCSAGGLFSTALAVLRSNYIAAAAPNSGGLIFGQQFQGAFTPALMTMHGAPGQDVVIIDFSDTSRIADQQFKGRGGFVVNCNHGGGHCGAAALAPEVWDFFLAHPYGVEPSPWAQGLPAGFDNACELF